MYTQIRKWCTVFEYSKLFLLVHRRYKLLEAINLVKNLLQVHLNHINNDSYRTCRIKPICRPMPINFQELIPMSINKDHCRSISINVIQFFMYVHHECLYASDPVLIRIDLYWGKLIGIDRQWALLSHILDQFLKIDLYWSALIGIWDS